MAEQHVGTIFVEEENHFGTELATFKGDMWSFPVCLGVIRSPLDLVVLGCSSRVHVVLKRQVRGRAMAPNMQQGAGPAKPTWDVQQNGGSG